MPRHMRFPRLKGTKCLFNRSRFGLEGSQRSGRNSKGASKILGSCRMSRRDIETAV